MHDIEVIRVSVIVSPDMKLLCCGTLTHSTPGINPVHWLVSKPHAVVAHYFEFSQTSASLLKHS